MIRLENRQKMTRIGQDLAFLRGGLSYLISADAVAISFLLTVRVSGNSGPAAKVGSETKTTSPKKLVRRSQSIKAITPCVESRHDIKQALKAQRLTIDLC
jgi:hypothetical protein